MILREEVNINKIDDNEYIIENKLNNAYVKLGKRETEFLKQFSTESNYNKDFNFTEDEKNYLIKTFLELKLIKGENDSDEEKKSIFNSLRRLDISKIKLYTFNPINLFRSIEPLTNKLLTKTALYIYSLILIIGMFTISHNKEHIMLTLANLPKDMSLTNIILLYIMSILTIAIHELYHGITCNKFTNGVKEMGIMIFYFQPAMYCNVSSVYLLKNKKQKIIIFGAGIFSQLVLSAVSVITYFIFTKLGFSPKILIYYSFSNLVIALYNLIPFIKLDGYWILSTLLNIQNLREKSINLILALIIKKNIKERYERNKTVLIIYGLLAVIFSVIIWSTIIMKLIQCTTYNESEMLKVVPMILIILIIVNLIKTFRVKISDLNRRCIA